jgi:hypothetical protein
MPLPFCAHVSHHGLPPKILKQGKSMLRIRFLNVGHGDCTIISHPSGRLTMIDINNSQDYDEESFQELLKERQRRDAHSLARTNPLQVSGLLRAPYDPLLSHPTNLLIPPPRYGLIPPPRYGLSVTYAEAFRESRRELTDPIEFLKREYPGAQPVSLYFNASGPRPHARS